MDSKFRNKYRIGSARLTGWDYGQNGYYFVTICTANREHLFGAINRDEMILSAIGNIVLQEWKKSFEIRAELFCDAFVIMPNHIHAILRIEKPDKMDGDGCPVETHGRASLQRNRSPHGVARRSPKSVSSFVAGFKSAATKRINEFRNTPKLPVWQSRFHDHIIRDEKSYHLIRKYIINNPALWQEDRYYE